MLKFINIVLITVGAIFAITMLTVDRPIDVTRVENKSFDLTIKYFPNSIQVISEDKLIKKEELFKNNTKTLLIVGNHDSMAVIKDLKKYFEIKIPYVMVANISSAPWFIKKWAIPGKLKELTQGINDPMIYDEEGFIARALNLYDTQATKYFVYMIESNGDIKNVYTGSVKEGAMEKGISEDEIKKALSPILNYL